MKRSKSDTKLSFWIAALYRATNISLYRDDELHKLYWLQLMMLEKFGFHNLAMKDIHPKIKEHPKYEYLFQAKDLNLI